MGSSDTQQSGQQAVLHKPNAAVDMQRSAPGKTEQQFYQNLTEQYRQQRAKKQPLRDFFPPEKTDFRQYAQKDARPQQDGGISKQEHMGEHIPQIKRDLRFRDHKNILL
nr:hypothetical protein [uncultured Oscillibacter sp.]